jgi:hypothetical protein
MNSEKKMEFKPHRYVSLSLDEAVRLMICVLFDVAEYAVPILLIPVVGDVLDIVGIGLGMLMFGWIGLFSILEFIPMADIFPIFIFIWIIWYYMKKEKEKEQQRKYKEKWK